VKCICIECLDLVLIISLWINCVFDQTLLHVNNFSFNIGQFILYHAELFDYALYLNLL